MTKQRDTRYCCPQCGSLDIQLAAWVEWNDEAGAYLMNGDDAPISEQVWCNQCEYGWKWPDVAKGTHDADEEEFNAFQDVLIEDMEAIADEG